MQRIIEIHLDQLSILHSVPIVIIPERPIKILEGEVTWLPDPNSPTSNSKIRIKQVSKTLFTVSNIFNDKETSKKYTDDYGPEDNPATIIASGAIKDISGKIIVDLRYEEVNS